MDAFHRDFSCLAIDLTAPTAVVTAAAATATSVRSHVKLCAPVETKKNTAVVVEPPPSQHATPLPLFSTPPSSPPYSSSNNNSKVLNENRHIKNDSSSRKKKIHDILSILSSFHAGYFRISLSLCGQALLWKTLITDGTTAAGLRGSNTGTQQHHHLLRRLASALPSTFFVFLWSSALAIHLALCLLYILRCVLRFRSVRAEFSHHVGVNYLFAPWISFLFLLQSSPFLTPSDPTYHILCLAFSAPVLALDVKIYGQWFTQQHHEEKKRNSSNNKSNSNSNSSGKRFLSVVANPTSQLSVIGNLAGARAAAAMGWRESAVCLFSLGIAHYLVLFVTLYQRIVGGDRLPVMLRPVFFLFFAAPSVASLAWGSISAGGAGFDVSSKMLFFLSLFLFASLVSRPALFKRSMRKFNVAWWAYSFPLTMLALASTEYAQEVRGPVANGLMLVLSVISVAVFVILALYTALHTGAILPHDDPFMSPSVCLQDDSVSIGNGDGTIGGSTTTAAGSSDSASSSPHVSRNV